MGLAEHNLTLGDLVVYSSDDDSTGGIVFQIVENCDPVKPAGMVKRGSYSHDPVDEKGKKIPPMKINGYVRLKPFYSFYPTQLGSKPKGKGETVLLYHAALKRVQKVDIVDLATKYTELGNVIRDVAMYRGMGESSNDQHGTDDRLESDA